MAIVAAGFTPGEADQRRRAMAAWRRKGNLQRYQDKLRAGMAANGLPPEGCPSATKPCNPSSRGPASLEVACNGTTAWKLYVPVKVSRIAEVVVMARPVGPGQPLDRSMLSLDARDTGSLSGEAIYSLDDALGYNAVRALAARHTLLRSDLTAPRVIRRGDQVVIVIKNGHVEVRSQGKALRDGAVGDVINVENQSSRRQVQARVTGPGRVETVQ